MRIGHYQCICRENDFERNLATFRHGLKLAQDAGIEILSFPESSLTGYYRDPAQARANGFSIDSEELRAALTITADSPVMTMVGFNEIRGEKLFNSVAVLDRGEVAGVYSKAFPIFDYFESGREFPVFEKNGLKFGIIICADSGYIEPTRILAIKGARVVFSPHHNYVDDPLDHCLNVRSAHISRANENRVYMVRANNIMPPEEYGKLINNTPYFGYGDSFIVDPRGQVVAGAGLHAEALMI
ncbi:MAG: carbon-nitrogen hydrolase family protein, partial [Verrucomicrobia bacterium]|nr:carbon-nitrogen hydrolase family protein [Verrucomicrobiota bacterium]